MKTQSAERFLAAFNVLEPHIERKYGLDVRVGDVPAPFTGDLDGAAIQVDYAEDPESALFILCHLFGHTVQWNLSARAREIGSVLQANPTETLLQELESYEREACRYSVTLLHEAGIHDLDGWLADFSACDMAYLRHFYSSGEKAPFRSFWRSGQPLLEPLPIPDFRPRRWVSRWQGVVV